jgi:excisionase family DNA binding protein
MPDKLGYYTSGEAAKYLGVSRDIFNRLRRMGKIKPADTVSQWKRYTQEELDRYREEFQQEEKAKPEQL